MTRVRRLAALLLPLLVASGMTGLAGPATAAAGATQAERYAAAAHASTNQQRTAEGLRALQQDRCLRRAAARQATAMARAGALSHQDLSAVLAACGLRAAGENVGVGFASGRGVVRGWMGSPGHRANLLEPRYRREGIAAVRDAGGRWWVAQVFGTRA